MIHGHPAGIGRRGLLRLPVAAGLLAATGALAPAAAARKTEFWFIRHAESLVNVAPDPDVADDGVTYPLTNRGIQQARELATLVGPVPISVLYTSTRLRCTQTADAISFRKNLTLRLAPGAVEINLGSALAGPDTLRIIQNLLAQWQAGNFNARYRDGESLADLRRRFVPFVDKVVARHKDDGKVVVIVAHGGVIAWTMPFIASNVSRRFALNLENGLPNTGIVKAELRQGGLFVTDWAGRAPA